MADQAGKNTQKDRRIIHCLLCEKPQDTLPVHLARVCMKHSTPEERLAELQRAKDSMKQWTLQDRNWDYNELCKLFSHKPSRLILLNLLRRRGFFVANAPNKADLVDVEQPSTSAAATGKAPPVVSETPEGVGTKSHSSTDSSDDARPSDPLWQKPTSESQPMVRGNMLHLGLYEKFPAETPILVDFRRYLNQHLNVLNCQQEVDSVSRMLKYILSERDDFSMDFLGRSTETSDYIVQLKRAKLLPSTILNYLKSMNRFVQYLMTRDILDQEFRRRCGVYIFLLNTLRKPLSKANTTHLGHTRYERYLEGEKSLSKCQAVLRVAKKEMLFIYGNLGQEQHVSTDNRTLFRYYCEAILILGHFQRPGAVEGMTVREWLNKKHVDGRVCIVIKHHKTSAMQSATFALSTEESAMLDAYYTYVRSHYVQKNVDDDRRFFLNSNGRPIKSATNDITRLHAHYKLPNINSREIRKVVETQISKNFTEEQKSQVALYMAHSTSVVEAHYRMRSMESVVRTANILAAFAMTSSDELGTDRRPGKRRRKTEVEDSGEERVFAEFCQVFPVSISGQPPTKTARINAGFPADRKFYDKWRAAQYGQREAYLLSKWSRHPPTAKKVETLIAREGWTANHPLPEHIVAKWRLHAKVEVETSMDMYG